MKLLLPAVIALLADVVAFPGCHDRAPVHSPPEAPTSAVTASLDALPDGDYTVEFHSDSPMFRLNETQRGKASATIRDGRATVRLVMASQNVVNLFPGKAEDAQRPGAAILEPELETVVYSDGDAEDVFAFDAPVPGLDATFDMALLGKKGVWYDHRVTLSNPEPKADVVAIIPLHFGEYEIPVTLEGGSGRAGVGDRIDASVDGRGCILTLRWNSPYFDYMKIGDEKFLPVNKEGNSVFELTLPELPTRLHVTADSVAMSRPHEIEYTLIFDAEGVVRK